MSNCLLNVVAQHLRFYYAVAESGEGEDWPLALICRD